MANLYYLEESQEIDDEVCIVGTYVTAPNIREALAKWKQWIASQLNEDVTASGGKPNFLPSDIADPISIQLEALEEDLVV